MIQFPMDAILQSDQLHSVLAFRISVCVVKNVDVFFVDIADKPLPASNSNETLDSLAESKDIGERSTEG